MQINHRPGIQDIIGAVLDIASLDPGIAAAIEDLRCARTDDTIDDAREALGALLTDLTADHHAAYTIAREAVIKFHGDE